MQIIQSIISYTNSKFSLFKRNKTDEYKVSQVMKVVDVYGSFLKLMSKEFHIKAEQSRCNLRYVSGTSTITGSIELDVKNEYQFNYVEEKFNRLLKHKLNKKGVAVDFYLNKLYN